MKKTRYIIKVTETAKPNNPNFAGITNMCYYGVDQACVGLDCQSDPGLSRSLTPYLIAEYGYKRAGNARRAAQFWEDLNENSVMKYWSYHTEIEAYEVDVL